MSTAAIQPSSQEGAKPLLGCRVLLTRPGTQAEKIAARIVEAGGTVMSLPMLEIDPVLLKEDIERVKTRILALDQYDIAIFISTNAANLGLEWIHQYWPQLPVGLTAYAVGPSTAEILRRETWPVLCSETGVTSEHLLALPGLQNVEGKRVALFRGQGGRELLADTLRERGARVDYVEVYQRRVPIYDRQEVLNEMRTKNINVAVLTSLQVLEGFARLLGLRDGRNTQGEQTQDKARTALLSLQQDLCVIVPSGRVRDAARAAGFVNVTEAGGADDDSIIASLLLLSPFPEAP